MTYIIEPLNENQEMNCRVKFSGNRAAVLAKAGGIAGALQTQLTGSAITCRVRKAAKPGSCYYADESGQSLIVTPDGEVVDEATGLTPKNLCPLDDCPPMRICPVCPDLGALVVYLGLGDEARKRRIVQAWAQLCGWGWAHPQNAKQN